MTANKYNSILGEIIHLAAQAELSDDDGVKRQTLADIYYAIAAMLPEEKVSLGGTETRSGRDGCPQPTADEPQGFAKFMTCAPGVTLVRFHGKDEIRLVARRRGSSGSPNTIFEIDVVKDTRTAYVLRDDRTLFKIEGETVGYSRVEAMAVSALKRWFKDQRKCNSRRRRALKRRRLGILTPEQELARTVAEQKEE